MGGGLPKCVRLGRPKRTAYYVIVSEQHGGRLCRDGEFRIHHVPFGTEPGCVKTYRHLGWAERRMDQLNRRGNDVYIQTVKDGQSMDASGRVESCR